MASLSTKIKLYCEANSKTVDFTKDVLLQDDSDGKGPYIKEWNISGLDKPTDSQLAAQETAVILKRQTIKSKLQEEQVMETSVTS